MRKVTSRRLVVSFVFSLFTFLVLQAQNSYSFDDDYAYYHDDDYPGVNTANSGYYEATMNKNQYYAPDLFVKEMRKGKKKKNKKSPFKVLPNFDINISPDRGDMNLFVELQSPHLGILDVELIDKKGKVVKKMQLDCTNEDCLEIALKYQAGGKYKLKFYAGGQSRRLVKSFKVFKFDGWWYA